MADRISEIKSLLERVSLQLVAELEAQREEIQILKEKVVALEKKSGRGAKGSSRS